MRLALLVIALALPALAVEPAGRKAQRKKAPPPVRPWESLLESSKAALEASKSGRAVAVKPAAPELSLPPAEPAVAPLVAAPAPLPLPALPAEPRSSEPRPATAAAIAPADDAPDLVARPRRVLVPAPAPAPALPPEPSALVAEPPPQTAAPLALGGLGGSISPAGLQPPPSPGPELNFDLLEKPEDPPAAFVDPLLEAHMARRRTMLTMHETVGIGLLGLMTGTMISGQLNYLDRFGGGAATARYERPHQYLATATLATFGAAGLLAFFAPVPIERESDGIDRATLHKIGMIGATLGMVAEGVLGILTAHHEGLADQSTLARAHLGIGYSTLACMTVGVGALVF